MRLLGKVKLLLMLAFPTTCVAEQGFGEVLHTRNKYRSRLDMNKARENAIRLKLTSIGTSLQTNLKKSCR